MRGDGNKVLKEYINSIRETDEYTPKELMGKFGITYTNIMRWHRLDQIHSREIKGRVLIKLDRTFIDRLDNFQFKHYKSYTLPFEWMENLE